MTQYQLVLGSASPRRVALLHQIGIEFTQYISRDEEPTLIDDTPGKHAIAAARAKADAVYHDVAGSSAAVLVLGADTVVNVGGKSLGKPENEEQAKEMLRCLSGQKHEVHTGIALRGTGELEVSDSVCTKVWMKAMSATDIDAYVSSGEPMDKAGAYAIQGLGARFVERISGCYYNVVGLPLARLGTMLEDLGFDFSSD